MKYGNANADVELGMKNVGGTFPIGEVFSEPKDLTKVNGELMIFGYPFV